MCPPVASWVAAIGPCPHDKHYFPECETTRNVVRIQGIAGMHFGRDGSHTDGIECPAA